MAKMTRKEFLKLIGEKPQLLFLLFTNFKKKKGYAKI